MRPPSTLTPDQRADAGRSLRTVGGVYDHIADYVQADTTVCAALAEGDATTALCELIGHFAIEGVCIRCGRTITDSPLGEPGQPGNDGGERAGLVGRGVLPIPRRGSNTDTDTPKSGQVHS